MDVGGRGGIVEGGLGVDWRRRSWHFGNKSMLSSFHSLGFSHLIYFLNCFTEEALLNFLSIFPQIKVVKSELIYWGEFFSITFISFLIQYNKSYKITLTDSPKAKCLHTSWYRNTKNHILKWALDLNLSGKLWKMTLLNAFQDDRS